MFYHRFKKDLFMFVHRRTTFVCCKE